MSDGAWCQADRCLTYGTLGWNNFDICDGCGQPFCESHIDNHKCEEKD